MTTYREFRDNFRKAISSRDFGAEPYSEPGAQSPAAKELEKTKTHTLFTENFLRSLYLLLREHSRIVNERPKLGTLRSMNVPKLVKLRNAQNSIKAVKTRIGQVQRNTAGLVAPEAWERVMDALSNAESELREMQQFLSAMLHPAQRRAPSQKVRWEHVLKSHKYALPTLGVKAPDKWLYEALNRRLTEKLAPSKISDMTRYRIMTALFQAFRLKPVQPNTFRLYFLQKRKMRHPASR
jgi:hypothetical protein